MKELRIELPDGFLESEMRVGYYVSAEMKKVWAVELDLLYVFSEVCKKFGLKWFVHAGTLLGAIRHHGFIPWDDDVDVVMPRKDYEVLCKLAKSEFSFPYFLQNEDSDPYFGKCYSKLINLQTTCIEEYDKLLPSHHCIFIDVFPYDYVPDEEGERERQFELLTSYFEKAREYRNLIYAFTPKKNRGFVKRVKHFAKHVVGKYFFKCKYDYREYLQKHLELVTKYNGQETECKGEIIIPPLGRHIWKNEWIESVTYMPFEMLEVPVPMGFEHCLAAAYGKDWRNPKQMSSMHSGMTYDADHSYKEFMQIKKGKA